MIRQTKYLYILFIILIYTACNYNHDTNKKLVKAEQCIQQYPDSSLCLLNGIDARNINSQEQRARYALLYSQALDKALIDVTNDSLINIAVAYYEKKDNLEKRFLAYLYQGKVYSNARNYTRAMLSLTKAEELINNIDIPYAIGLLYAKIGEIHNLLYNYSNSLAAYTKAYQFYGQADKEAHQIYAKINIGQCHIYLGQYEMAEKVITEALEWSFINNTSLCQRCIGLLSTIYTNKNNILKLDSLFNSRYTTVLNDDLTILQAKAYLYACKNDVGNAKANLLRAWSLAENINDTTTLLHKDYKIKKMLGDYTGALNSHERLFYIQDTVVRSTLQKPIQSAQRDYFKSQSDYNQLKLKTNQQRQIYIISISIFILSLTLLYISVRIKSKNEVIARYIEITHDLQETLISKNHDVETITKEVKLMNDKINTLFNKQFLMIDKLSNTYYETHCSKKEKEAIYNLVRKEIEKLQDDKKHIAELESIINYYKGNIMDIARNSLPEFMESDFRLLCYFLAGFSAKAISIFTGDSIGNIYMKKSRLKIRIQNSTTDNKEDILRHL